MTQSKRPNLITRFYLFSDAYIQKNIAPIVPNSIRPNHLTIACLVLSIPFFILILKEFFLLAFLLFLLLWAFDILDGHVARARKMTSTLGAWLDPLTDKIIVLGGMAGFCILGYLDFIIVIGLLILESTLIVARLIKFLSHKYFSVFEHVLSHQ